MSLFIIALAMFAFPPLVAAEAGVTALAETKDPEGDNAGGTGNHDLLAVAFEHHPGSDDGPDSLVIRVHFASLDLASSPRAMMQMRLEGRDFVHSFDCFYGDTTAVDQPRDHCGGSRQSPDGTRDGYPDGAPFYEFIEEAGEIRLSIPLDAFGEKAGERVNLLQLGVAQVAGTTVMQSETNIGEGDELAQGASFNVPPRQEDVVPIAEPADDVAAPAERASTPWMLVLLALCITTLHRRR